MTTDGNDVTADLVSSTPGDDATSAWREKVAKTMINAETLLATDYLNHFNEVIMLIGMISDMPEMFPEIESWRPKTYQEHFSAAGFDYGPLAAEVYDHVPEKYKRPFEITVGQLNDTISKARAKIAGQIESGNEGDLKSTAEAASRALTALIAVASGIVAGDKDALSQDEIDRMMG